MAEVITNVDVNILAHSPLVRAFMLRVLDELRDPLTGNVFPVALAKRAADAFDLHHQNGATFPRPLIDLATQVVFQERGTEHHSRASPAPALAMASVAGTPPLDVPLPGSSPSTSVHRPLLVELIRAAPSGIVDDILTAAIERAQEIDGIEGGHGLHVDRADQPVRGVERSTSLPSVVCCALNTPHLSALTVLALDQLAIDGSPADVGAVADAAWRFLDAVGEPAVAEVVHRSTS